MVMVSLELKRVNLDWNIFSRNVKLTPIQGRIQEFVQGRLKFFFLSRGGSAPVGAWKTLEINRFYWSRGGLVPIAPLWIRLWPCSTIINAEFKYAFDVKSNLAQQNSRKRSPSKIIVSLVRKHANLCRGSN